MSGLTDSRFGPRLLVLGGINMGLIAKSSRLPLEGETVRGDEFHMSSGGKGATQAVAASRLGAKVKMFGRIGDDLFGPKLKEALLRDNIDVSGVAVDKNHHSGVGVITLDSQGRNRVMAIYGANLHCDDEQLEALRESIDDADVLILQMEIPFEVSVKAASIAKDKGVTVLLDPAPASFISEDVYSLFDVVSPNQTEAKILTDVDVNDVESAARASKILLDRGGSVAIVKMGELGVYFASSNETGFIPPFSVEVTDTTSAGDAFHGALGVALAEGDSMENAVRFAAAAGAMAVTRLGVQDSMPVRPEVERLYGI